MSMHESIKLIFERMLNEVSTDRYRYLYEEFNTDSRLSGIIGGRGVGKTTLMLQYIKNSYADRMSDVFYFSADHIYFNQITLYEYIESLYLTEDKTVYFIDEIHKYKNWNQELKNLYDGFPDLTIIFSGSSSLDLVKGSYDLSRRAKLYHLPGMSFREYLNFNTDSKISIVKYKELIDDPERLNKLISTIPKLKGHFQDFLQQGYYPFYEENPLDYYERLLRVIDKTIYEDIANFYKLKTENLVFLKKILLFLASIPPGNISVHNIGSNLKIDDKTVISYLFQLSETGLVNLIYPAESGNQGLRRPDKVFLNNTNLQYALEAHIATKIDIGTIRELYFIQSTKNSGMSVFHSKQGDYQIDNIIFEIGGKNKTRKQIKNIKNAFLVKDDILTATKGVIPLMFFGFLY